MGKKRQVGEVYEKTIAKVRWLVEYTGPRQWKKLNRIDRYTHPNRAKGKGKEHDKVREEARRKKLVTSDYPSHLGLEKLPRPKDILIKENSRPVSHVERRDSKTLVIHHQTK